MNKTNKLRRIFDRLHRLVRLARIKIAKAVIKVVLPKDLWIGNHFGLYTQKWSVELGKLDPHGVLQGVEDKKA
jgi:hypothetical protein